MAYKIDAASEGLTYDGSWASLYPLTVFMRFMRNGSGGSSGERMGMFWDASSLGLRWFISTSSVPTAVVNSGGTATGPSAISDGVWYDCIVTLAGTGGTDLKIQYGTAGTGALSSATASGPPSGYTLTKLYLGNEVSTLYPNATIDDTRIWSAVLSDDEIARERLTRRPARTANLEAWYPILGRTSSDVGYDYSGNGRTLTANGSPAYVDGAPISWGAIPLFIPMDYSIGPTLSAPGVNSITASSAIPKVTLTF